MKPVGVHLLQGTDKGNALCSAIIQFSIQENCADTIV
jgi:hypothetical protein